MGGKATPPHTGTPEHPGQQQVLEGGGAGAGAGGVGPPSSPARIPIPLGPTASGEQRLSPRGSVSLDGKDVTSLLSPTSN